MLAERTSPSRLVCHFPLAIRYWAAPPLPLGTVGTAWDGNGTVAKVRIVRVYRPWDGGTAVHPQATQSSPLSCDCLKPPAPIYTYLHQSQAIPSGGSTTGQRNSCRGDVQESEVAESMIVRQGWCRQRIRGWFGKV